MNNTMTSAASLIGRALLSLIFITSGWSKIVGYAGTAAYMAKAGLPGGLLPLVILTELGGGLLILFGFKTRLAALLLAGFCLIAGYLFHFDPANQGQMINFWKNITIAGGFLVLIAHGAGGWSLDGWRSRAACRVSCLRKPGGPFPRGAGRPSCFCGLGWASDRFPPN
jgi:putative oxidoreductase